LRTHHWCLVNNPFTGVWERLSPTRQTAERPGIPLAFYVGNRTSVR
jgi:hypothetical protein